MKSTIIGGTITGGVAHGMVALLNSTGATDAMRGALSHPDTLFLLGCVFLATGFLLLACRGQITKWLEQRRPRG